MNLLAGLEKFGIKSDGKLDITDDGTAKKADGTQTAKKSIEDMEEKDLVLQKSYQCPICDHKFKVLVPKSAKVKRIGTDADTRPHFHNIDTIKYDVVVCPRCGYAAMTRQFEHLSATQMKWVKEAVCSKFTPVSDDVPETYSPDEAVDRYKLALVSAMAKHARTSEKARICLNIAWIRRDQIKEMSKSNAEEVGKKKAYIEEYNGFYRQAYEGYTKAYSTETGLNSISIEYLLANMAIYFKEYGTASKLISGLLGNPNVSQRVKDRCLEMKDKVVAAQKKD